MLTIAGGYSRSVGLGERAVSAGLLGKGLMQVGSNTEKIPTGAFCITLNLQLVTTCLKGLDPLILSLLNNLSFTKSLACSNFQSASMSLKVCENVV